MVRFNWTDSGGIRKGIRLPIMGSEPAQRMFARKRVSMIPVRTGFRRIEGCVESGSKTEQSCEQNPLPRTRKIRLRKCRMPNVSDNRNINIQVSYRMAGAAFHHFIKPRTVNSGTEFKVIFPLSGVLPSRFKRKRWPACRLNPRRRPLRPRSEKTTPA